MPIVTYRFGRSFGVQSGDQQSQPMARALLHRGCAVATARKGDKRDKNVFSEILGILQIIPNIIPNLGILGRVPSEPSMLGGVPNADRNIPFRAFIQCSVGARTDTIIK